jgi:hypothetical protein
MSATELLKLSGRKKNKVEVLLYSTGEWYNNTNVGNSNILLSYVCKDAKGYSVRYCLSNGMIVFFVISNSLSRLL